MLTTFDVCVEHSAILYFWLVTITSYSYLQTFELKELEDFALANTTQFFELTRLPFDFLSNNPSQSEEDDTNLSCEL